MTESNRKAMTEPKKRRTFKAKISDDFRIVIAAETSERGRADNRRIWQMKRPSTSAKRTGRNASEIVRRLTPSQLLPNNWYSSERPITSFTMTAETVRHCHLTGNIFKGNSIELPPKYTRTLGDIEADRRGRKRHKFGRVDSLETLYSLLSVAMSNGQKSKAGSILFRISELEKRGEK